jgi:hypothetical protein
VTTRSFPGSHDPDADHLNTLLDAMRSGVRAPEHAATGGEASDLAAAADQFRALDERGRFAAGASDARFDSIWEDMMSAHATTAPATISGAASGRSTGAGQRVHPVPPPMKISRMQSFLSAAIVAIMIAGLVSAAWNLRSGGGDDPGPSARLAATVLDGTPEATPGAEDDWWTWTTPEECEVENTPYYPSADDTVESTDLDWAASQFIPFMEPSRQEAEAVASVAREIEGCKQAGLPFTELLSEQNLRGDLMQDSNYAANYYRLSREISEAFPITDPGAFVRTTTEQPVLVTPDALTHRIVYAPLPIVFIPDQAVMLADGRIGMPVAALLIEGRPDSEAILQGVELGVYRSNLLIFTEESGELKFDRELTLCIGECDWLWEMHGLTATPEATPEASPIAETDWRAWMTPEECAVEPISDEDFIAIMQQEPEKSTLSSRSYAVIGTPEPAVAQAVARTARGHEVCHLIQEPDRKRALESPTYVYISNAGATSYQNADERIAQDIQHGRELSAQLPIQDPGHYIAVVPSIDPRSNQLLGMLFDPGNAMLLEDGRVAIAGTMFATSELDAPFYPGAILIFTAESGDWLLDEKIASCVGDCEDFWARFGGGRVIHDGTPAATPVATPQG